MHNIKQYIHAAKQFPILQYLSYINVNVNLATTKIDLQTRIYRLTDTTKNCTPFTYGALYSITDLMRG